MKILIAVDNELLGDNRVLRQIAILRDEGFKVRVMCYAYDRKQYDEPVGVDVKRLQISKFYRDKLLPLSNRLPLFDNWWSRNIAKEIKPFNPNYLLVHDLYMSRPGRIAIDNTNSKIKLILDLHENFPIAVQKYNWTQGVFKKWITKPLKWKRKESQYLNFADEIIVLHDNFKNKLEIEYPDTKGKYTIFPNIPDIQQLEKINRNRPISSLEIQSPILFYVGVVASRRGIFEALEAFKEIRKKEIPLSFLIAGPIDKNDKSKFFECLSDPAIVNNIQYIPWIEIHDLPAYLKAIDICIAPFEVNPQHESGIANKIFQYMYGGKPLIVSNNKPQADIIHKFDCGIVYKNKRELVDALETLSSNKSERIRMGLNAKQALNKNFNINKLKKPFIDIFKNSFSEIS